MPTILPSKLTRNRSKSLQQVSWQDAGQALRFIRQTVFMEEQHVPAELEWDGLDETAWHFLAYDGKQAIGCARLLPDGHLGRMAVLPSWRNQGVGQQLLQQAIVFARQQKWSVLRLSAQMHAIPFYEKSGFTVCSEPYMDAGIPHCDMQLQLD